MMHAIPYLIGFLVPGTVILAASLGGWYAFATPIVFFVITPILDECLPRAEYNANSEEEGERLENPLYNLIVRSWLPAQVGAMVFAVWRLTSGDFTGIEYFGIILSTGILGGTGINVAHELMHRSNKFDKALAELLTASVTYTHFCIEHIYGHHKNVATTNDPATSRFGQNVYNFVPKSLLGGLLSAWEIETRLVGRQRANRRRWYNDRRIRYSLELVAMYGVIAALFGPLGAVLWLAFGLIASTMLEIVNYIEHYGLERLEVSVGKYERVQPHHSWSSSHRITGWLLFGLPRHADHHYLASRHYPVLRHFDDCPQLPAGYATMFLVALVPSLWFKIMDPRVIALANGDAQCETDVESISAVAA
jgi:alkane 1-monooxygenase